jgi:hypothetical protein
MVILDMTVSVDGGGAVIENNYEGGGEGGPVNKNRTEGRDGGGGGNGGPQNPKEHGNIQPCPREDGYRMRQTVAPEASVVDVRRAAVRDASAVTMVGE